MSISRYSKKRRMMSEINVVPYIDVMLVLLIIFMVTAPLLTTGVIVDLPEAPAEYMPEQQFEPFVVTIDAGGNYYLNDDREQVSTSNEIVIKAGAVLQRNPEVSFMVRGDGDAKYSEVVEVMVLLQNVGVESVGLITDSPES